MKILKIFGIVVGIHVFALILIFANPGCSSTSKPGPAPTDTVAGAPGEPNAPSAPGAATSSGAPTRPQESSAITFNPDAPATAPSASGSGGVRVTPMRPGSAQAPSVLAPTVVTVPVAEPVADLTPSRTYSVKAGDSLWSIAKKHNITVTELAAANSLSTNATLKANQKLLLPGRPASATAAATATGKAGPTPKATDPATATAAARSSGEGVKHIVKSGESLGMIARTYGVRQGDIAVANNISDPAKIKAGTELIIPGWQPTGKSAKGTTKSGPAGAKSSPQPAPPPAESAPSTPPPPPSIPIIRIGGDENPITPAPRP